jgi:hypothetical protein
MIGDGLYYCDYNEQFQLLDMLYYCEICKKYNCINNNMKNKKCKYYNCEKCGNYDILLLYKCFDCNELFEYKETYNRVYGYYKCKKCKNHWTSAYTWRLDNSLIIKYKQECKKCKKNKKYPYNNRMLLSNGSKNKKIHLSEYCDACKDPKFKCYE